ncbi:hypothetical protein MPNT_160044 [Candidatus Methylacidithermus pantelleriae]|uniref:Uncharacterized protein n=1 Tax=Candidatus Methylacidithermus pantelleriae TaxID=2744239 RepID=A0A8J2FNQ3_9BACT|nr:hypothetical protein MPNT_160044 [Candidatus Methylacidithermus pantelleriae]
MRRSVAEDDGVRWGLGGEGQTFRKFRENVLGAGDA